MMNTDDISFADFLAFNAPPVSTRKDPWTLHAYAFVPLGVEAALERVAKLHDRATAAMQFGSTKTSTLLLTGASIVQQRAAVRWLSERLDLPAFIVNACELSDLPAAALDELLAPLAGNEPRLFVIRNVDALPAAVIARLIERRPRSVFMFATLSEAGTCSDALRARFRATIDWHVRGKRRPSALLVALFGASFARFVFR